jgi:hypothetical protein
LLAAEGVTLLLTSRGAFLAAVIAAGFVGLLRYRRLVLIGGAGALLVLALGLGRSYIARLQSGLAFQDQAQLMRLAEYQNAVTIISRYPAFGVGFGRAGELDLTTGVSSVYLTLAERTGLFGLVTFVVCMAAFFLLLAPLLVGSGQRAEGSEPGAEGRGQRVEGSVAQQGSARITHNPQPTTRHSSLSTQHSALSTRQELDSVILGTAAAVLGALVVGVGDHYYFNIEYPHMVALLWLLVALGLAARRLLMSGQPEQEETIAHAQ